MKYYLLALAGLVIFLGVFTIYGGKITGSTSSEKWGPDGSGNHGNSSYHHK